jgi:ERCC4-type nuclease
MSGLPAASLKMLVSPAERPPLDSLGTVSSLPESYGADYLIHSPVFGVCGVQRKELKDLVASLSDDRFSREVIDMKELEVGIWIFEGRPIWSADGQLISTRTTFTQLQFDSLIFSLQSQGFWVIRSEGVADTMRLLSVLEKWLKKREHSSLNRKASARGVFGEPDTKEWQVHFLQGLPGIGYDRASAIRAHYAGMPFELRSGVELTDVPGIGKRTAQRIREVLDSDA